MMKKEDRYSMAVTSFLEALDSWPQKAEALRVIKAMSELPCSAGPPSWPDDVRSAALNFLNKTNKSADAGTRIIEMNNRCIREKVSTKYVTLNYE